MSKGPLSTELSARARQLLKTKGHVCTLSGEAVLRELVLPELSLDASVQGTLMIEETGSGKMLYMESPNGTVIRASPDEEMRAAIEVLKRHMVLDDLAEI